MLMTFPQSASGLPVSEPFYFLCALSDQRLLLIFSTAHPDDTETCIVESFQRLFLVPASRLHEISGKVIGVVVREITWQEWQELTEDDHATFQTQTPREWPCC